jgi:hypothetical protein
MVNSDRGDRCISKKSLNAAIQGIDAIKVGIEVDVFNGIIVLSPPALTPC